MAAAAEAASGAALESGHRLGRAEAVGTQPRCTMSTGRQKNNEGDCWPDMLA